MSVARPFPEVDKRPLPLNLSSNNPFRNRTVSPAGSSLPSPSLHSPGLNSELNGFYSDRSTSKNPFLDDNTMNGFQQHSPPPVDVSKRRPSPTKPSFTNFAAELFDNLTIHDKPTRSGTFPVNGPTRQAPRGQRPENIPPPMDSKAGLSFHHPTRSYDNEREPLNGGSRPRAPQAAENIFADPTETARIREHRRPRRNSDSSVNADDERRRRERRYKEREARYRDRDSKLKGRPLSPPKPKKISQRLDVIDKLDVTSIYGTGLFHHDGPFDACNPHRNRRGQRAAPMQAFPANSANNVIGGSGPVNKSINLAQFHGRGAEGFTDFSTSGSSNPPSNTPNGAYEPYIAPAAPTQLQSAFSPGSERVNSFNPKTKVDPVHGDESMGLGTSTFLEGAPASRAALQRTESGDGPKLPGNGTGLGRKRSIAQKIRGISNGNRNTSGRMTSPDTYEHGRGSPTEVLSSGGVARIGDNKPFLNDYDEAYEKKGARIQISEEQNRIGSFQSGRTRAPSSPMRPAPGVLERRVTNDGLLPGGQDLDDGKAGGGFLNRVRSLKGGRRTRPERREFP